MHAVSCCDDPFTGQHGTSAAVLGAVVHTDLPGPAPCGHIRTPNHPSSTGVQPTLCKGDGEHVIDKAQVPDPHNMGGDGALT